MEAGCIAATAGDLGVDTGPAPDAASDWTLAKLDAASLGVIGDGCELPLAGVWGDRKDAPSLFTPPPGCIAATAGDLGVDTGPAPDASGDWTFAKFDAASLGLIGDGCELPLVGVCGDRKDALSLFTPPNRNTAL